MDTLVCFRMGLFCKAFMTLAVLKRRLIGVDQHMVFQCGSSPKYFSTDLAGMFFHTGVAVDISDRWRATDFPVA